MSGGRETAWLVAGKRFPANSIQHLDELLAQYSLVSNPANDDGMVTVRRVEDRHGKERYSITQSYFESTENRYDVCVGILVRRTESKYPASVDEKLVQRNLRQVRNDIPDAELLLIANWAV
ncbi:hypothetical protein HY642_00175 [Candidatus Woesearchaeota archaeon]|nr:hypothetical protein [Candidatus Woesearchaeota archaeon]